MEFYNENIPLIAEHEKMIERKNSLRLLTISFEFERDKLRELKMEREAECLQEIIDSIYDLINAIEISNKT